MRAFLITLVVAIILALIVGFLWFGMYPSHYIRMQHKSHKYYVELAAACESILTKHHPGTKAVISVPVTDPSLPTAVKRLHPLKMTVGPGRVWMLLDSDSHAGIGLEWQPKWGDTNVWELAIIAESFETTLYSVRRSDSTNFIR